MSAGVMVMPPAAEQVEARGMRWVLDEWDRHAALLEGVQIVDRIDRENVPGKTAHLSVWIDAPRAQNTHRMRDRAAAWLTETILATVLWRISPLAQKGTRRDAYDFSDRLVAHMTDRAFHAEWDVSIEAIDRGRHPASVEWYVLQHTFTMRRFALVGG